LLSLTLQSFLLHLAADSPFNNCSPTCPALNHAGLLLGYSVVLVHDDRQQHMWVLNNTNQELGLVNTHRVNLYKVDVLPSIQPNVKNSLGLRMPGRTCSRATHPLCNHQGASMYTSSIHCLNGINFESGPDMGHIFQRPPPRVCQTPL